MLHVELQKFSKKSQIALFTSIQSLKRKNISQKDWNIYFFLRFLSMVYLKKWMNPGDLEEWERECRFTITCKRDWETIKYGIILNSKTLNICYWSLSKIYVMISLEIHVHLLSVFKCLIFWWPFTTSNDLKGSPKWKCFNYGFMHIKRSEKPWEYSSSNKSNVLPSNDL